MSDMRMPEMSGTAFLMAVRDISPDSVRIILTGVSDVGTAAACVNQGQIFRFLEKPCATDVLRAALVASAEHHRLIVSERVLLEQTLKGSIGMLVDVLALASPVAFSRAVRLKRTVSALAESLGINDIWQIEVAAQLSQLGAITMPPSTVDKLNRGETLDARESEQAAGLALIARQLIAQIPRLEEVCEILDYADARYDGRNALPGTLTGEAIPIGARLLKLAVDVDTLETGGHPFTQIAETLRGRVGQYDPRVVSALSTLRHVTTAVDDVIEIRLSDVRVGMIFAFDVAAENGLILIGRGQEATQSLVRRIQNHWRGMRLREPARVIARTAAIAA
jgi:response regulator RpfG family c-di-GMP phosphodiesterase